ncbi:MAG: hypothetical protein ACXABO_19520 [Promethearchaeota archaeon]|jgi:hypothetical protein
MCEFKIIRKNDGSQILDDVVILSYNDNSELMLKDVIGMGEILESALIIDVNTMNQKCFILEHPIIKDFIQLTKKLSVHKGKKSDVDFFIEKLTTIRANLEA